MNNNNKLSLNTALNPGGEKCFENSITFLLASYWLAKQLCVITMLTSVVIMDLGDG
jgi:hypothetical protein